MKRVKVKLKKSKPVRLQILCKGCGESFWTTEYLVTLGRKYCSMECVANDKGFGKNNKIYDRK